jgi:hypothetical protein
MTVHGWKSPKVVIRWVLALLDPFNSAARKNRDRRKRQDGSEKTSEGSSSAEFMIQPLATLRVREEAPTAKKVPLMDL